MRPEWQLREMTQMAEIVNQKRVVDSKDWAMAIEMFRQALEAQALAKALPAMGAGVNLTDSKASENLAGVVATFRAQQRWERLTRLSLGLPVEPEDSSEG
jgi:hypothetical protein